MFIVAGGLIALLVPAMITGTRQLITALPSCIWEQAIEQTGGYFYRRAANRPG